MHPSWLSALMVILCGLSLCGGGEASPESVCKRLIPPIAKEVGVPASLLKAIAFVESRYQPYALNHQGKSLSFTTPGEAFAYVETQLEAGDTALDIGCMQIHWKAHQKAIEDPKQLLNPAFNIRYAAKFLKGLYQELGTWSRAVSAYHSRTGKGRAYLIRVAKIIKQEKYDVFTQTSLRKALVSRGILSKRVLKRDALFFTPWKSGPQKGLILNFPQTPYENPHFTHGRC